MQEPIYFSKVEYQEWRGNDEQRILLLNLVARELSYQVLKKKKQMPGIEGTESIKLGDSHYTMSTGAPARIMKNGRTDFEPRLLQSNVYESEVVFSYALSLNEEQMKELFVYCNALEFEPYRHRKMTMQDEGYIGYRDETDITFCAVTDSYLPKLELPMSYYYAEKNIWPSEKLYRYLITTFLENNPELIGWQPHYGECSLIW